MTRHIESWFWQLKEIENWGWNEGTYAFLALLFLSFWAMWGLWHQNKKIWDSESGESVSVINISYSLCFMTCTLMYGMEAQYLTLMIVGVTRISLIVPTLIGLYKYKNFKKVEWVMLTLFSVLIVITIISPEKMLLFFIVGLFGILAFILQPLEIFFRKKRGAVEIRLLWVVLMSSVLWSAYGLWVGGEGNKLIAIMSPGFTIIALITIILWYKYPNK